MDKLGSSQKVVGAVEKIIFDKIQIKRIMSQNID